MRMRILGALLLAGLLTLAGCGGQQAPAEPKAPSGQAPAQQPAPKADAPKKQWNEPPAMQIDPKKSYIATMETALGTMKIELFAADAPGTVNNFVFLAREGFYDGLTFHRVIQGFMIQGGDPQGTGTGGPGYRIKDELPPKRPYGLGMVAMARTQAPNSAGSQFFICSSKDCGGLDKSPVYTQFGQVIEGLDVLSKLEKVPVGGPENSRPKEPLLIKKVSIQEK